MRFPLALAALSLLLSVPVSGTEEALVPNPRRSDLKAEDRLGELVERVRYENDRLVTLEASFKQLKTSELLIEPVEARGVFSFSAPDHVLWEYLAPDPISLLIEGEVMTTWYKDIDQAEKLHVGKQSEKVLEYMGASGSMARLLEYFDVVMRTPNDATQPYKLELSPRFARVEKRIREMQIWIHPELFIPIRLRYVEGNGDSTEYDFTDLKVNSDLPDDRFELDIPESVNLREVDLSRRAASR